MTFGVLPVSMFLGDILHKVKSLLMQYIIMNFMNRDANLKQFEFLRYVNENSGDEHVMSKISIVLRNDKIEAPYYMVSKIKLSSCIDRPENGLIHAMDMMNHHRRYNLTENEFSKIRALIEKSADSDYAKISKSENQLQIVIFSRSDDEIRDIFDEYCELFDAIESLID